MRADRFAGCALTACKEAQTWNIQMQARCNILVKAIGCYEVGRAEQHHASTVPGNLARSARMVAHADITSSTQKMPSSCYLQQLNVGLYMGVAKPLHATGKQ